MLTSHPIEVMWVMDGRSDSVNGRSGVTSTADVPRRGSPLRLRAPTPDILRRVLETDSSKHGNIDQMARGERRYTWIVLYTEPL
jgi:hypothetical protein